MENINKFNVKRVLSLCKMTIAEQPRVFVMLSLVLIGILAITFTFISVESHDYFYHDFESVRTAIYIIFVIYGTIYTSLAFGKMRNKKSRTSLLMIPALQIEKYVANFVVYVLFYIVAFVIAIYIADIIKMLIISTFWFDSVDVYPLPLSVLWREDTADTLAIYLFLQSFYWLGAILWPRNSFIKTYSALAILSIFYAVTGAMLYKLIIGTHHYHLTMFDEQPFSPNPIMWTIVIVTFVINYVIAYMRLKETDVVQKLL